MIGRLIKLIVLLSFLSTPVCAQAPREKSETVHDRAQRLEPFIRESAKRYGIDPQILRVLCFLESRYRLDALSPKGARGPMQFMPATAIKYGLRNPHDPSSAVDAGARYFRDLLRRFNGRLDLALAAYNAGEGSVEAFILGRSVRLSSGKIVNPGRKITGGIPPYRETQQYVKNAISLLMNRPGTTSKPFAFRRSNKRTSEIVTNRDFSLDVLSNNDASTGIANSSFIDVP